MAPLLFFSLLILTSQATLLAAEPVQRTSFSLSSCRSVSSRQKADNGRVTDSRERKSGGEGSDEGAPWEEAFVMMENNRAVYEDSLRRGSFLTAKTVVQE